MTKVDLEKQLKRLYDPSAKEVSVVDVPRMNFLTIDGLPALYRGLRPDPDDRDDLYVFRIDLSRYGIGTVRVVFSRDAAGATTGMHLDGILLSAEKQPANKNPRLWITGGLGALAVAITVGVAGVPAVNIVFPHAEHGFDLVLPRWSPAAQTATYYEERFLALVL